VELIVLHLTKWSGSFLILLTWRRCNLLWMGFVSLSILPYHKHCNQPLDHFFLKIKLSINEKINKCTKEIWPICQLAAAVKSSPSYICFTLNFTFRPMHSVSFCKKCITSCSVVLDYLADYLLFAINHGLVLVGCMVQKQTFFPWNGLVKAQSSKQASSDMHSSNCGRSLPLMLVKYWSTISAGEREFCWELGSLFDAMAKILFLPEELFRTFFLMVCRFISILSECKLHFVLLEGNLMASLFVTLESIPSQWHEVLVGKLITASICKFSYVNITIDEQWQLADTNIFCPCDLLEEKNKELSLALIKESVLVCLAASFVLLYLTWQEIQEYVISSLSSLELFLLLFYLEYFDSQTSRNFLSVQPITLDLCTIYETSIFNNLFHLSSAWQDKSKTQNK